MQAVQKSLVIVCVVSHHPMASAFKAVAQHVLGADSTGVHIWLDVNATDTVAHTLQQLQENLDTIRKQVKLSIHGDMQLSAACLILTDLPHATPHNCAVQWRESLKDQGVESLLISPCTVPMVLRAISNPQLDLTQLHNKLLQV